MITLASSATVSVAATNWYGASVTRTFFSAGFSTASRGRFAGGAGASFVAPNDGMTDGSGRFAATLAMDETAVVVETVVVTGRVFVAIWLVVMRGDVLMAVEWELHDTPALQIAVLSGSFNNWNERNNNKD